MKFQQAVIRLIIAAGFIAAGFLLPLPDSTPPVIPPQMDGKKASVQVPSSQIRQHSIPEDFSHLFEVRPVPACPRDPKPPEEQTRKASSSEPASPPPPLPPLRYVGEAVIQGRTVYYLMAGCPERLVRLPGESEDEYRLISTTENELILEYRGAKYRLRRP
ncbi:hypothetical protein [Marispirochaeta aestuarii]|uniref:hypothetical protein n=1 Tax=Marispirochaeta aestuarii TaxID=1963862 RepID=UPI0029C6320B|nr:hypothetical protein [Marispirochaeta aestuarii]